MKVLITGASSDISVSLKSHLETKGHTVSLTSHKAQGNQIPFDLANPQAHEKELDNLLAQGLDALILNAATPTYRLASVTDIDWQEMSQFLNANIQGNIWLLQKVLPVFAKQKFGRIVFVSSMNTQHAITGYSAYAAAKSALETVMKYVAHEYGENNITANSLRLGIIHTQRNDKFVRRSSIREKMESSVTMKRLGKPEDLHLAIESLIDKNCYIQGTSIEVSGGFSFPA